MVKINGIALILSEMSNLWYIYGGGNLPREKRAHLNFILVEALNAVDPFKYHSSTETGMISLAGLMAGSTPKEEVSACLEK